MSIKIVCDSSSNVFSLEGENYTTVPMKVIAGEQEFVDTPAQNVAEMVAYMKTYKGKSGSSCPNVQEWLDAFGSEDDVIALTISGPLSGSYNAASQAAEEFLAEHPDRKAYVMDTRTAGPQMMLIADKLCQLIHQGLNFEDVVSAGLDYARNTHILFCLESMLNLARNGRISKAAATIAGLVGIRGVGDVEDGQITTVAKPRGQKKAVQTLVEMMKERGFSNDSRLRIAHCQGQDQAQALVDAVTKEFPGAKIVVEPTTVLCSFYAEEGGLMIGFEGAYNAANPAK